MQIKEWSNIELAQQLTSLLSVDATYKLNPTGIKELNAIEEELSFRIAIGIWFI